MSSRRTSSVGPRAVRLARTALSIALLSAPVACVPSLALVSVRSDAAQPGKVTVDFTVTTKEGQPVTGLTPEQFGVFEDGERVARALVTDAKDGAGNHYVLTYCSPARGGPHQVRVFAHAIDRSMGELVYAFSADGFGPGCDVGGRAPEPEATAVAAAPPPAVVEKKVEKKVVKPKKPAPEASPPTVVLVPAPTPSRPPPAPALTPAPAPEADPFAP